MEATKKLFGMLDLLIRPAFCVKDHLIVYTNNAARSLLLCPGMDIRELLLTGQEEYDAFQEGWLYLQLNIAGGCGISVYAAENQHIFLLDQESDDDSLRAMSLAARELREPLTGMQMALEQLSPEKEGDREQLARLNRGIHQILRILGNMSDAHQCDAPAMLELRNVPQILESIFEKAAKHVAIADMTLHFQNDAGSILSLLDEQLLERAVWNILSNSIKFSPKGSILRARLSRRGRTLLLSITDPGSGIAEPLQKSLFRRYLRQPGIEDGRFGLGLGMVLIRSAAVKHGGTVLMDQSEDSGTRITLTLPIRQDTSTLHSPVLRVDYSGEQDHGLVELADCLPLSAYYKD